MLTTPSRNQGSQEARTGVAPSLHPSAPSLLPSEDLINKYSKPGPRYTSYPPVPYWSRPYCEADYRHALQDLDSWSRCGQGDSTVSVYVHVPFCEQRCVFCACNVVTSRAHSKGRAFVDRIAREVDLVLGAANHRRLRVLQLHLGGGTPTWLPAEDLAELHRVIGQRFDLLPDREQSVEVDPRVTTREQLEVLVAAGLNRISLGVQDLDPKVQDAIYRNQTFKQTDATIRDARALGVQGVNIDLVYGLPFQTLDTVSGTMDKVVELSPDRIALYNFAYLPEQIPRHAAIKPEWLPTPAQRLSLFRLATQRLFDAGYIMIGLDHFAKATDELALAAKDGSMQRNFMGYTTRAGCDLMAFGPSAISRVGRDFAQNVKGLEDYENRVDSGRLPIERGMRLSDDDLLREHVIQTIMCYGRVDFDKVRSRFSADLLESDAVRKALEAVENDGLISWNGTGRTMKVTPEGRFFLRNIAMIFDAYLGKPTGHVVIKGAPVQLKFSKTV
jgi:oxygen-independent coproporphyrinogen III oxidase